MSFDKSQSPVGWYVGSYLLRFFELQEASPGDLERRFVSWENTVIVQAGSIDDAYAKIEKIGKQASRPYRGGATGVRVKWEYLGVTELLPIYEDLADGAEIMWTQRSPRKLKSLLQRVRSKASLCK